MPGSRSRVRAGIELAGRTLRYAEVEVWSGDYDSGLPAPAPGLIRMGACDFDFEIDEAVLSTGDEAQVETVGRALADIFRESDAEQLCVAVHGWQSTSFFSPLPVGIGVGDKFDQLRQETGLLADVPPPRPLHLGVTPVRMETLGDGRAVHWHHVLHMPEDVHNRAATLGRRIGPAVMHRFVDSAGAAAAIASRGWPGDTADGEKPPRGFTMTVGLYDGHVEVALVEGDSWFFGQCFDAVEPADVAYFGAALLEQLRIQPSEVLRLLPYGRSGSESAVAALESLVAAEARPLNPLPLFRTGRSQADPWSLAMFVPSVGAALR